MRLKRTAPLSELLTRFRDPPPDAKFHEPRFHCLRCEDTGFVSIWHPETIKQAMRDVDSVEWWREVAVLCTCDAASSKAQVFPKHFRGKRAGKPVPTFGDQPWQILSRAHDAKAKAATFSLQEQTELF